MPMTRKFTRRASTEATAGATKAKKVRHLRNYTITAYDEAERPWVIAGTGFSADAGGLVIWVPRDDPAAPPRAWVVNNHKWCTLTEDEPLTPLISE